jgi:AcrR family transcriptional regulator
VARRTPEAEGDGGALAPPARRAPFADNPTVGARGLRTQLRILDAAVQAFGAQGYDRTTLDRIAQLAGCSRVSIYQYFSGKDDLFRNLAGQVARQLRASLEALDPVTPDGPGHVALRAWVARYADIRARFEPIFRAFDAAAESDESLAAGALATAQRNVGVFEARLGPHDVPPRLLDATVELLLAGVNRALDLASMLQQAAPEAYARDRVDVALADVFHRVLFGMRPGVNVHRPAPDHLPTLRLGPSLSPIFEHVRELEAEAAGPGRRALASMLEVGDDVLIRRGYRGVRVDDVIEAAGVSHGSFYSYFENIEDFLRVVAVRAVLDVSAVVRELPPAPTRPSLRKWLRRYNAVHSEKGPMIRVWVEAVEAPRRDERAAVFDWGRRRMVALLAGREFGDVELDALLLLAIVETFGARARTATELDAALFVLERGFLGRSA